MDNFKEREQIKQLINTLFISIDNKDWRSAIECFTENTSFDMSSMDYGSAGNKDCEDVGEILKNNLSHYDHIHHQTGDFRIDHKEDGASVFCYVVVFYYKESAAEGKKVKRAIGSYQFEIDRVASIDKIASLKFNLKFIDGNKDI